MYIYNSCFLSLCQNSHTVIQVTHGSKSMLTCKMCSQVIKADSGSCRGGLEVIGTVESVEINTIMRGYFFRPILIHHISMPRIH